MRDADGILFTIESIAPASALERDVLQTRGARRVVLVGGQTFERPAKYLGDAWTWDGVRWAPLPVSDGPSARAGAALLDDAANGRLLYFGGYAGPPMRLSPELWFLDSAGWRLWTP